MSAPRPAGQSPCGLETPSPPLLQHYTPFGAQHHIRKASDEIAVCAVRSRMGAASFPCRLRRSPMVPDGRMHYMAAACSSFVALSLLESTFDAARHSSIHSVSESDSCDSSIRDGVSAT